MTVSAQPDHPALRHVRPPRPLHFPVSAEVPESKLHLEVRTALYLLLKLHFSDVARIGSDQFMYLDAGDPKVALAPDVFVSLGGPDEQFDSWKIWERGVPELAVEVISRSDSGQLSWNDKLARYHHAGVRELVRFEPDSPNPRLRVWDRIEGDLVERVVEGATTPCAPLGLFWVVDSRGPWPQLRLARDAKGRELLPTEEDRTRQAREAEERERAAGEQERVAKEQERVAKERALARVAELERQLRERDE